MNTRIIVRIRNQPVEFDDVGYSPVASNEEATAFPSREEAIEALRRRRIGAKGVVVLEVPLKITGGSAQRLKGGPQ